MIFFGMPYAGPAATTRCSDSGKPQNLFFKGADVRNQSWQPEIKAQKRPIALLNLLFGAKIQHYL